MAFFCIMGIFERLFGNKKRARDLASIDRELADYAWKNQWLYHGLYTENGGMFVIAQEWNDDGTLDPILFRVDIALVDDQLQYGTPYAVTQRFEPAVSVERTADGELLYYGVVGSAFVNRDGEIDSTQLFENFVNRQAEGNPLPYLDVYHLGEKTRIGRAIANFAIGALYYEIGKFDDSERARAWAEAIATHPDKFGFSIAYQPAGIARIEKIHGVSVPVYDDGVHVATSLLLAEHAAAHFTGARTRGIMSNIYDERIEQALELLPEDARELERTRLLALMKQSQRTGMAFRAVQVSTDAVAIEPDLPANVDDVLPALAEPAIVYANADELSALQAVVNELMARIEQGELQKREQGLQIGAVRGAVQALTERIEQIDLETKQAGGTRRSLRHADTDTTHTAGVTASEFSRNL